jgi:hypothetical protein
MSRFYPHTAYAEDQPYPYTILSAHVVIRSVETGSVIGTGIFATRAALARFRNKQPAPPPQPLSTKLPPMHRLLRANGTSTAITVGLVSVGLVARMWGREEIEWKDRSWRLLENRGQSELDNWSLPGMAAGLTTWGVANASGGLKGLGWRGPVGAVGSGSAIGVLGYMVWRYGVNGGKFPEKL